ncbi:23S rRNA (uracil(1939)-C(5))-methyltransferase RlmD [Entomohabitans teleogrylli]|uniref:23S rRNA (uracil(1939)-C(5))-methyltransferase RlmD n=1 Tax=Entomohabitans teleogrylli TaxID=1384589 RepID=UPI00073D7EA9|nr:23S rRNA (uracil(1939)-C(5))-methyltransferase RlmD [Entomohabitans teleogrylli]
MAQFYSAKRRVSPRQIITVTVNDLDSFGQGVAKHNGKTLFIAGALPGESVEAEINEDKRQYSLAVVKRRLNDSPQRQQPRCPHFGVCGGCQQQHVAVELQQASKSRALARMMKHEVDDVIAGPAWGYRRRARLSLQAAPRGGVLSMGFRRAGSKALVDIHQCPILAPRLEALLTPLRECLSGLRASEQPGHVELVLAGNGPLMVLRHLAPLSAADRQKLEQFSHHHDLALFLAPQSDTLEPVRGESPWYDIDGLRLSFSPRDFIQVNDAVNQQMVRRAIEWLDPQPHEHILDLFCGMGNFTLPLSRRAVRVTGVEGVPELVAMARGNAQRNGAEHAIFFHENLEEDVTRQPWAAQGVDKVLLDPARAGAPGVMNQIVKLSAERVVYVSCNPSTLARDSEILLQNGFQLTRLTMLDMFPHTGHLESMALFVKR